MEKWKCTDEEYHAHYALGSTSMKALSVSIKDFTEMRAYKDSDAAAFGRAVHILAFEPEKFDATYHITEAARITPTIKKEAGDKEVIKLNFGGGKGEDYSLARARRAAKLYAQRITKDVKVEVPIKVCHKGIWLKAKLDAVKVSKKQLLSSNGNPIQGKYKKVVEIFDLKTVSSAEFKRVANYGPTVEEKGWDMQAYHYRLVCSIYLGIPIEDIDFVFWTIDLKTCDSARFRVKNAFSPYVARKHRNALCNFEEYLAHYSFEQWSIDPSKCNPDDFPKYGDQIYEIESKGLTKESRIRYNKAIGRQA